MGQWLISKKGMAFCITYYYYYYSVSLERQAEFWSVLSTALAQKSAWHSGEWSGNFCWGNTTGVRTSFSSLLSPHPTDLIQNEFIQTGEEDKKEGTGQRGLRHLRLSPPEELWGSAGSDFTQSGIWRGWQRKNPDKLVSPRETGILHLLPKMHVVPREWAWATLRFLLTPGLSLVCGTEEWLSSKWRARDSPAELRMAPERHETQREGGNSPVVQWLGLKVFTAGAWVQSLGRELGSCEVSGVAKTKKKKAEGGKGRGRERRTVPVEVWDKPEGDDLCPVWAHTWEQTGSGSLSGCQRGQVLMTKHQKYLIPSLHACSTSGAP